MLTRFCAAVVCFVLFAANNAASQSEHPSIFHAFKLEGDVGEGRDKTITSWDFDGWIGGDFNKLVLKSEGEVEDGDTEKAEIWALYSKNVAEFWDLQSGIRQDTEPHDVTYLVVGVEGLAKYFFETEAHLFLSDEGDFSARLRQENDLLITQRLIVQPYFEINIFAQDVPEEDLGGGFTEGEIGLQTRFEITRKFAPYFDLHYERKFGETSGIARREGERKEDLVVSLGLRLKL